MSDPRDNDDDSVRLRALEAKLAQVKQTEYVKEHGEEHYSQAQHAWRMVIELVSGLGIGFGIGYGLDVFFGTLPVFLIVFIFLGFAAGVKTVIRSAQEMQRKQSVSADEQEGENRGN